MPFEPGQSGNPLGTTKGVMQQDQACGAGVGTHVLSFSNLTVLL